MSDPKFVSDYVCRYCEKPMGKYQAGIAHPSCLKMNKGRKNNNAVHAADTYSRRIKGGNESFKPGWV